MSADASVGNSNALVVPIYDKIPLSYLLEAAVQKTYHELYTMADVLHSKSNPERKIELVIFACRARQLFIRILAVVKWAATTGKVTACEGIQALLEIRARLIRETSDSLAQLAREKLLEARVPNFPVTDAIDALTLGSVNFLPKRIAEAATNFTSATESERQQILPRLQQILTARISTSELPIQFSTVTIKNGLVILTVHGEFEVKLGITNDNLSSSWRLYQTKLFVQDPEEPEQDLVHPSQIYVLTNFIQSWLNESEKPLFDLYQYLHYYCQSLRLQVLFEQAHRIRNQGAKQKDLLISGYSACKSFNVEYWKDYYANNSNNNQQKKTILNGKNIDIGMTILCDNDGKFQIQHWPPLPIDDTIAVSKILEKPIFTMEEILNRTIFARCQRRFEELKETILSTTKANIEIDSSIPALKCELLPESTTEEILFISINPFSGFFKVVSYMAHINCNIYTRIPSLNLKNELTTPFISNSIFIELIHNEGFYILVHVSDVNQLLIQYYLLIVEKRSSTHESVVLQQQDTSNQPTTTPPTTTTTNEEYVKWTLEPLVLYPLDPTTFLRKELFEFKNKFQYDKTTIDDNGIVQAKSISILSLKSLLKFVNYYDEMLSFIFLKENFQQKKTLCKNILYCPWTGIPYLDIVRISTDDASFSSNTEIVNYVNEYFWPRIQSCTIRLAYTLRDIDREHKSVRRQWTLDLNFFNTNYFHNAFIKTPFNSVAVYKQSSLSATTLKIVDFVHLKLRGAFELTHLFENYSLSLLELTDLHAISKLISFNFFQCTIHYGPNFTYDVTLSYNNSQIQQELISQSEGTFDLRFITINNAFLPTYNHILSRKLILFLNQTRSLKQLIRLLHMISIPLSSIARLNCFSRPIIYVNHGGCAQSILTFIPYTESRWRLIFGQMFAVDIQICGPNLILVRDGSFSVQLNNSLVELAPIPRLKEFLSLYADDHGLTFEFSDITGCFHMQDFLSPIQQAPLLPPPPSSSQITNQTLNTANDSTSQNSSMDTTAQSPVSSHIDIYDVIFRDALPITSTSKSTNVKSDQTDNQPLSVLYSYNRELLTKANYPVYMTQQTFFQMLFTSDEHQWSKFESFLASSVLVRQFAKGVTEPADANNPTVRAVPTEQDTYRLEHLSLQLSFIFDIPTAIYRMYFTSLFDSTSQQQSNTFWSPEELQIMEIFFNETFFPLLPLTNLTMPPIDILSLQASQNLNTAMGSFQRMLSLVQPRILKDLVKIIRLEQNPESHHLWQARWCLTMPQGNGFSQVGQSGIYYISSRSSFIFMFQFMPRINQNDCQANINTTSPFIVPLIHDVNNNQTNLWDGSMKQLFMGKEVKYQAIARILNLSKETMNKNECSLYLSILELITRLQLPLTSNNPSS
ncbi:unnamed protein product [Rotaria socialis]|uniref:Mediator of RNA polymerase II transcription subunit 14 n=1 Tax=Rotaria socialis TaxID=392032 RepID=A0A817PS97_9BILA|nr:unnamed protein product [Rotaria socialis]CAF4188216.1 unnamed protein product [Rotaria socialis]CAF4459826.1 unnamed protein product [Rotaria socialis]